MHHAIAANWIKSTLKGGTDRVLLPMPVISGFFRWATHPKVFLRPSSAAQAVDFIDWLLKDSCVALHGGASERPAFRQIMLERHLAARQSGSQCLARCAVAQIE